MYACKTLSLPDEQGLQTCLEWQEQTSMFALPDLTAYQASQIAFYILLACVAAFCFKLLGEFIKKLH